MIKPNILETTTSIWDAISFKKDSNGNTIQAKQGSYKLPVIGEEKTKRNISALVKLLRAKYTVRDISTLLMECLDEAKFQYMLSHNGFRLAKNIPKDQKITVADIYAFSQALKYWFSYLPSEPIAQPVTIVSGVMAPAGQDLGCDLLTQLWETRGYTVINLGAKIKPLIWIEAVDKHQPNFLSISCMLNACIENLRELLSLLSTRKDNTPVCVGGVAIDKFLTLKLSQEYCVPIFYGINFTGIQKSYNLDNNNQMHGDDTTNLPDDITALCPGEISCYHIPINEVVIESGNRQNTRKLLSNFDNAVIITTSSQPATERDTKILVRQLLRIEKLFGERNRLAFSFHYPIPCPFCLPNDCKKNEGQCMNPSYTRPFPKEFHINLSKTMENANITDIGLGTLILVKKNTDKDKEILAEP